MEVALIASNNEDAGVLSMANSHHIPTFLIDRENFKESTEFLEYLEEFEIDLIVLAGFLWLIPEAMVKAFDWRIINIHPSLLPKFGGKGMYGQKVHQAVSAAGELETGISIHFVNQNYDEGKVILQEKISITPGDDPKNIAAQVLKLEHHHYPRTIEKVLASL